MQKTLLIMRVFFIGLCLFGSWLVTYSFPNDYDPFLVTVFGAGIGILVILTDIYLKGFSLSSFTALTFGLAVGAFFSQMISWSGLFTPLEESEPEIVLLIRLVTTIVMMYLGAVIAIRGREEFYLVIPYVRFNKENDESPIILIDTSALIDGRIEAICRSGWLNQGLIIPSFVLNELQTIADSTDMKKQERGRKGLKVLNEIRRLNIDLRIHEVDLDEDETVDEKLLLLAQSMKGRLLTTDYNLAQMAQFRGVEWLNLNELSKALLPDPEVGGEFEIELVREGKEPSQAVGYLRDGSMVVVNNAHRLIGDKVMVEITSIIPSSGGKMIFAELCKNN